MILEVEVIFQRKDLVSGSTFVYTEEAIRKKPAKYVVFGISEGTKIKADRLAKTIEQIVRMGKDAVVAVIERRGEVIYYKMSKVAFQQ